MSKPLSAVAAEPAEIRMRLQALAAREGLDERSAGLRLDDIDRSRVDFVRRHYHSDPADASHYDMVIDAARFGLEGSADLICRALALRGLTA